MRGRCAAGERGDERERAAREADDGGAGGHVHRRRAAHDLGRLRGVRLGAGDEDAGRLAELDLDQGGHGHRGRHLHAGGIDHPEDGVARRRLHEVARVVRAVGHDAVEPRVDGGLGGQVRRRGLGPGRLPHRRFGLPQLLLGVFDLLAGRDAALQQPGQAGFVLACVLQPRPGRGQLARARGHIGPQWRGVEADQQLALAHPVALGLGDLGDAGRLGSDDRPVRARGRVGGAGRRDHGMDGADVGLGHFDRDRGRGLGLLVGGLVAAGAHRHGHAQTQRRHGCERSGIHSRVASGGFGGCAASTPRLETLPHGGGPTAAARSSSASAIW